MNTKDLAEFYGISHQAVQKWPTKKRQQKTTQALAGAEPQITNLIGDINQLSYIFDCQHLQGIKQVKWISLLRTTFMIRLAVFQGEAILFEVDIDLHAPDSVVRLLLLKNKLSEMVYGAQKID